jgi:translation initiation factor IF-3
MSFLDKGRELLERVARDCSDIGRMDAGPIMEGRYMRMTLMPLPQKGKEKREEAPKAKEEALE